MEALEVPDPAAHKLLIWRRDQTPLSRIVEIDDGIFGMCIMLRLRKSKNHRMCLFHSTGQRHSATRRVPTHWSATRKNLGWTQFRELKRISKSLTKGPHPYMGEMMRKPRAGAYSEPGAFARSHS